MKSYGLALFFFLFISAPLQAEDTSRFENRLNELMIWKLSDEMGLKPQDEQKLKTILKKFQGERKQAMAIHDGALVKLNALVKSAEAARSPSSCPTCLEDIQKAQAQLLNANNHEFKELKILLGDARMGKFLVIRNEMTRDVREALRQPAASSAPSK